jgi:hypothetical protein
MLVAVGRNNDRQRFEELEIERQRAHHSWFTEWPRHVQTLLGPAELLRLSLDCC